MHVVHVVDCGEQNSILIKLMSTQGTEHFMVNAHPHFPCIPSKDGINPNPRCFCGSTSKNDEQFFS